MTSENNGMVMPVAPYYGGGYGGNGGGFFDGNSGWWIILLLLIFGGGWGNGFGGGFGGGGFYPWMNQANDVQRGFDQSAIISGINGVQNAVTSGFGDVQNALCSGFAGVNAGIAGGFAGVNAGIANGFAQAEIANNARQMAGMQQAFAAQTAQSQGFNSLASQFANCCCENRLGIAGLNSTILSENCADRAALSDGVRDLLVAQNNNTQRILDQMCADKIDAKNEEIANLRQQLAMKDLAASQSNQTACLIQQGVGILLLCSHVGCIGCRIHWQIQIGSIAC